MRAVIGAPLLILGWALVMNLVQTEAQAQAQKVKYSIQEIMDKAHESDLYKKVAGAKADKKEVDLLLDLYTELAKNKPPKGPDASWKEKTGALIAAAKGVAAKDKDAGAKLLKAATCKACHDVHQN